MSAAPSMEQQFEEHRPRLRALALRMLGSPADADDALQDTWIRAGRQDVATIDNPGGWLTTVTARVCLNALRARAARPEVAVDVWPESTSGHDDPVHGAVLADAVGMALLVVLDSLSPPERVAFVLHDMFGVPFEEIAPIVDRSVETTRQLASRARRRVRPDGGSTIRVTPDPDPSRRRAIVDAFFAAARHGDLDALVAVLHPDVVLIADPGSSRQVVVHGAAAVADRATMFANPRATLVPVLVDDDVAVMVQVAGRTVALMVFIVADGSVTAIDATTDRDRLATIEDA
ncbi:MAG: sigma-70 family RNA polymerase sigma factor [Ilumatobacteraceae bacterium]